MAKTPYEPPVQGRVGMIIDSIFLLGMVYLALLMPLIMDFSSSEEVAPSTTAADSIVTWESLGQNQIMQTQWERLGVTLEDAEVIINDKFDYTIHPISLVSISVIIVGYFFFLLRVSDKEYREVINERFGE
jgi:hypothetical protein